MRESAATGVSVIVPTYRRPLALQRCLASLAQLDYPRERFEVIVVDDDGGVDLEPVVSTVDLNVTLVRARHGGPAAARNKGAAVATFNHLAFIDDDCLASENWLKEITRALSRNPDAIVGGRVDNALLDNTYARASQTLITFLYRYYHQERRGRFAFFTTNNLAVRKELFDTLGGFDESFEFASEDREWSDRCQQMGYPLIYAHDALVHHECDLNLSRFLRQHYRYGQGAWSFHRARVARRSGAARFEVEGADFYLRMLFAPFATGDSSPVLQSFLLFCSQAVAALGYLSATVRGSNQSAQARRYALTSTDLG